MVGVGVVRHFQASLVQAYARVFLGLGTQGCSTWFVDVNHFAPIPLQDNGSTEMTNIWRCQAVGCLEHIDTDSTLVSYSDGRF